jgi:hypothetical protein
MFVVMGCYFFSLLHILWTPPFGHQHVVNSQKEEEEEEEEEEEKLDYCWIGSDISHLSF